MARVLITGGAGFIGTNLVQLYLDKGDEVLSLDLEPPRDAAHAILRSLNAPTGTFVNAVSEGTALPW